MNLLRTSLRIAALTSLAFAGVAAAANTADTGTLRAFTTPTALKAFDPSNPGNAAITIATGAIGDNGVSFLPGGTYASGVLNDVHIPTVLYILGGKLFKASLLIAGSHTPVRVSSEAEACSFDDVLPDFNSKNASPIFYLAKGADGMCDTSDDVLRVTHFGDTSTIAPEGLGTKSLVAPIYGPASGAINGFLIRDGATVMRVGPALKLVANVMSLTTPTAVLEADYLPAQGVIYLAGSRKSDAGITKVFRYGASNGVLTPIYSGTAAFNKSIGVDTSNVYIADGQNIRFASHTATTTALLGSLAANVKATIQGETSTRLIVSGTANTIQSGLFSFALGAAGGPTTLLPVANEFYAGVFTAGSRVHVNRIIFATGTQTATVIEDNASAMQSTPKGFWLPSQFPTTGSSIADAGVAAILLGVPGANPQTQNLSLSRGTGTFGPVAIGTLSGLEPDSIATLLGFGRYLVGQATYQRGPSASDTDIIFYDTQTPGSLAVVQSAAGVDETPRSF